MVNLQLTPIIKNARTNYRYTKALNHFVTIRHFQAHPIQKATSDLTFTADTGLSRGREKHSTGKGVDRALNPG